MTYLVPADWSCQRAKHFWCADLHRVSDILAKDKKSQVKSSEFTAAKLWVANFNPYLGHLQGKTSSPPQSRQIQHTGSSCI